MEAFRIGRDSSNDFIIENDSVSGNHAYVEISEDLKTFVLKDDDSTNGTFVDNQEIISKTITKSSEVNIGEYHLNNLYFFEKLEAYIHENREDFSVEFAKLKTIEKQYKNKIRNIKRDYQLRSIGLRIGITGLIVLILFLLKIDFIDEYLPRIALSLFSLAGVLTFIIPIDKKIEELKDELYVKHAHEFVCPKCEAELVQRSFNYWTSKKKCPKCKCTWTHK